MAINEEWFTLESVRSGFLHLLFFSIPFSIAGDDFAIIGLYLVTIGLGFKKRIHWKKTPIIAGLVLYLVGALISTLLSDNPLMGFPYFRNFWRLGLPFIVLFALKDQPVERYIRIMGFVAIAIGLYALAPKLRLFYALSGLITLLAAILSFGRSIWLGVITIIVVFLLALVPQKAKKISFAVTLIVIASFWFSSDYLRKTEFAKSALGSRMLSITSLKANKNRLMMWEAGVEIVKDHPILGLGPNMFHLMIPYYNKISDKNKQKSQHPPSLGVHNIYLQNWIDFGLTGLLGFLLIFLLLISAIKHKINRYNIRQSLDHALLLGIMAGICGFLVAGFFENNFRDGEVQVTVLTIVGIALALLNKKAEKL